MRSTLLPILGGLALAAGAGAAFLGAAGGGDGVSLRLETVVSGLEAPVEVARAPGEPDRLYVVEQPGRIRIVEDGVLRRRPFAVVARAHMGESEQGLLGLAFHPDYARNGRLYVHFTDEEGDTHLVEHRADRRGLRPGTARELLFVDQPYENHNGGKLAFGPDGRLHLALGDGGSAFDPKGRAQDPATLHGKLLAFDVEANRPRPEILAYGLRNPWRFSFDRATGDLWVADVGQHRVEEVNVVRAGERRLLDFGWDVYEGRRPVERKRRSPEGLLTWPVATYGHDQGCSITGGVVYRGRALPELRGRYLFGDYCSGTIWSLRWNGGPGEAPIRPEGVELPRVVAFAEDGNGEVLLASQDGRVYRLVRGG